MPRRLRPRFILIGMMLAVLFSATVLFSNPRARLFALTGEQGLGAQIRGVLQWAWGWSRLRPHTASDVAVAFTDCPPFGINTFLEQEVEPEKRARSLQMIADAGFYWIRQSFPWYDLEIHGKDDFEDRRHTLFRSAWDKYDNIVALAEQHELHIIARLEAPPDWSRHDGTARGAFGPPDDLADYGDYVAAVAHRYRGRVQFYQIWNEPNIYPEWGKQPVQPEAYTALLCLAYQRIKAVDPEAVIISGAMAQTMELGTWNEAYQGNNMMDTVFLQRMYNAGAQECFDIMAVNDYMLWSAPTDQRVSQREVNFSRPMWVRDVMVSNGDAAKPIWLSEMNSNAAPEHIAPRFGRVTLEQQAQYAPLAYERIQREWPWVGVSTVWFFKRAGDAEKDLPFYYFRLVDPDFTPQPIYASLSTYLNTLTPTLYAGQHQETAWQLMYNGDWQEVTAVTASLGRYRQAQTAGAQVTVTWEGRRLIVAPGPGQGKVRIQPSEGTSREVVLQGGPIILARHTKTQVRTLTLIALDNEVTLDVFEVK